LFLSRTGFYGASSSNFFILLNEGLAEFLVFYYNDRFPPIRKLYPAQPKNQAEFHSILDDIGVVTNRDDDFVLCNDSESF
jgi:hypothetical protein